MNVEGYNFLTIKSAGAARIIPRGSFGEYKASRDHILEALRENMLGDALVARQKLRAMGLL